MRGGPRSLRDQVAHQTGAEEVRAGPGRSLDSAPRSWHVQVGGWEVGAGRKNTVTG